MHTEKDHWENTFQDEKRSNRVTYRQKRKIDFYFTEQHTPLFFWAQTRAKFKTDELFYKIDVGSKDLAREKATEKMTESQK